MRTVFYLTILFFSLVSCAKSSDDDIDSATVVGRWKQTAVYNSNGGSTPSWNTITNGYTIEFLSNGTFNSSKFSDCSTGTYTISSNNEISMTYNCENFKNNYVEKVETNTESQLILKPNYLDCDEGCSVKFEKIN